jgi:hypothetical protein
VVHGWTFVGMGRRGRNKTKERDERLGGCDRESRSNRVGE